MYLLGSGIYISWDDDDAEKRLVPRIRTYKSWANDDEIIKLFSIPSSRENIARKKSLELSSEAKLISYLESGAANNNTNEEVHNSIINNIYSKKLTDSKETMKVILCLPLLAGGWR